MDSALKQKLADKTKMNLLDLPELPLSEEQATILAGNGNVCIKQIISTGQTSEWYDQSETEFVTLLQGEARIEFESREITLVKGDTVIIKPHERHRVSCTSTKPPCVWLCVFY